MTKTINQTYFVTGGAGFLGSHLVDRLLLQGHKVICLDNEFRGLFNNIEHSSSKNLKIIKGDIRNIEDWPNDTDEVDGLFHLAAINGTKYFYSIPETVLDVNVKGISNALDFVRKNDIEYFSFASTPEAYGIPNIFPTPENTSLQVPDIYNPRWSYGASKIIGEIFCANYAKKYGFKCSILRYHNSYGPKDSSGHVIPDLFEKILNKKELVVEGNGDETRSFCYVDDSIDATLLIKEKQSSQLDVFNVGIDVETKIKDLVNMLAKISNYKITPVFKIKDKPGTTRRIPDITKLKKLGYSPKITLEKGLTLTYDWYLNNINRLRITQK